ncbi:XRE family transcriptional regulator [Brevundimonas sp. S30B]|jgi:transcriptional regulator with XRE-family HTH domain|uniref:helix-turn-helix domain-containing protein n=1 Tax=unclassified Brevundimonas TaxID=2622653 RepID=UPI0010720697|nr:MULTISPECIES: helix-turn-helix transcriptional regulator [unclassified Brevundimonas]QBX37847.1 XRE family transcriptional regulator [Brevundimonas sp. MF30-B]TFW02797.1 XRE family transcriptional regulator [Brevundimonas sp. S30B]
MMADRVSRRAGLGDLAASLRAARAAKGWSQRELGGRAGLPQAQISKIETAEVDPQVSTLLELARSLDLDLRLVPRVALTAVEATVKDAVRRAGERDIIGTLNALGRLAPPSVAGPHGDDLRLTIEALRTIAPHLGTEVARYVLTQSRDQLAGAAEDGDPDDAERARETVMRNLRSLYDTHSQAAASARPAYSLDDED